MKFIMNITTCLFMSLTALISYAEESSGSLVANNYWYETPTIPSETQLVTIKATFTNLDVSGRDLTFSITPYQLWGYEENRAFLDISAELITEIEVPDTLVAYNETFNYELKIDTSSLTDLETLAFRIVSNEAGTMSPVYVPASGSSDEVTFELKTENIISSGISIPVQTPTGDWVIISM